MSEQLRGSIERVTFHNEENGFCVLRAKVRGHRDLVTVIGSAPIITAGEFIEATGQWIQDKQHGVQFKSEQLRTIAPSTTEGIVKYLSSGMVKGIGAHYAKKLVAAFGEKVFDIIEQQPEQLHDVSGIGKKRAASIISGWQEQKSIRDIMIFLHSHGVGTARAVRIYKTYGDNAISLVHENPYRLAQDIHGIGFKTADEIAMKLGIDKHSLIRAEAGLLHHLLTKTNSGHCAAFREELIQETHELLDIPLTTIEEALARCLQREEVIADDIKEKKAIFPAHLYRAENVISHKLRQLQQGFCPWGIIDPTAALDWVQKKVNIQLSDSQQHAISVALRSKVMVITGGPGVGKTTVVNSLLRIIKAKKMRIVLCAPTGRAAKRLSEVTYLIAKTIHRQLHFDPSTRQFKHNTANPLHCDYVVIDEASMLDVVLLQHLLKAIPLNAGLLIIGDVDQLPSVGPGAVLKNIIDSEQIATHRLTEIFRQARHSKIITNAHRINEGSLPYIPDDPKAESDFYFIREDDTEVIQEKLLNIVAERIPSKFGLNPITDIQVLTPMHRGLLGARNLNVALQKTLNDNAAARITKFGVTYATGDKVIQLVNNYDKEVFNGDIGFITRISEEDHALAINFEDREVIYQYHELDEINLAYATTIHKSQGSEYPAVVIPVATEQFMLLARNLIYTGVTRGKKLVIIIGQIKALAIAVKNISVDERLTKLTARLKSKS